MTKKDYEAIAEIVRDELDLWKKADKAPAPKRGLRKPPVANREFVITCIANRMANYFKKENKAFDKDTFMDACGVSGYSRVM